MVRRFRLGLTVTGESRLSQPVHSLNIQSKVSVIRIFVHFLYVPVASDRDSNSSDVLRCPLSGPTPKSDQLAIPSRPRFTIRRFSIYLF